MLPKRRAFLLLLSLNLKQRGKCRSDRVRRLANSLSLSEIDSKIIFVNSAYVINNKFAPAVTVF